MIDCPRCYTPANSKESIVNCSYCHNDFENIDDSPIVIEEEPTRISSFGAKYWENEDGYKHREDGPAVIFPDGREQWWLNGKIHREDGPAVITLSGNKEWYINGKLHRLGGPAIIWNDGTEFWYKHGERTG